MPKVTNTRVHNLAGAIYASGYPMMAEMPSENERFNAICELIDTIDLIDDGEKKYINANHHIKRAINLANIKGGGHDQFLSGILVCFDLTFSQKAWVEMERYRFMTFVSSQSTMHRLKSMDMAKMCNQYVSETTKELVDDLSSRPFEERELAALYNIPMGLETTAAMVTNYRCLKNIYRQRRNHRLPDWQVFCNWIEELPLARQLLT